MTRPQPKVLCNNVGAATTGQLAVDCRGYNYLTIAGVFGGTNSGLTGTTSILEESDDGSTYATVNTGLTLATTTSAASVAKIVWNVDLRGRKRYVRATVAGNFTNGLAIVGLLYNASKDQPVTAAAANATHLVNI